MKKIARWFLILVICFRMCVPAFAATSLPELPVDLSGWNYLLQLNAAGDSYILLLFSSGNNSYIRLSEPAFSGSGWWSDYTWMTVSPRFQYRYVYKIGSSGWVKSESGLSEPYTKYVYGNGNFVIANSIPIMSEDLSYEVYPVRRAEDVRFGLSYSTDVPAPSNVRYVKTGEDTAGLVWDNNDPDDKYHVVIRGVFHWKNNNPVGSWIQDNTPFTGDSSGDVTVQLLSSSDLYRVSKSGYSIPDNKFEEVKAAVAKEAKKSATWWSWYPSEFQVQYFGYDENGDEVFGDAAICKINWSNVKKGEWTSSTMIYSGGVKDDTGADGEQSTTHKTQWGEVMGGGGASWDDSNEYDSSGNIVKSDASKNTLQDFINGLVNIPDILNRFFQTIQVLMSGISQLPALFSTIVSYMPPEFVSLLGMGLVVVIILRIFGR